MRQLLTLTLSLYAAFGSLKAQDSLIYREINFENNDYLGFIDLKPNSSWQIGSLQAKWGMGYIGPNGISTDTLLAYKASDTSSFILRIPTVNRQSSGNYNAYSLYLGFRYKMEVEAIGDFGLLHLSLDKGNTWKNIADIPEIDGSFPDTFNTDKSEWFACFYDFTKIYSDSFKLGDTLLVSFEFTSDSNIKSKKGWAIDAIQLTDNAFFVGLPDHLSNSIFFDLNGNVRIDPATLPEGEINIYSTFGTMIKTIQFDQSNNGNIQLDLNTGYYIAAISSRNIRVFKKIIFIQ